MIISVFDRVENIVGRGENAGYQYNPFPTMFLTRFLPRVVKIPDHVVKV